MYCIALFNKNEEKPSWILIAGYPDQYLTIKKGNMSIYENLLLLKNINTFKKNNDRHNVNTKHKNQLAVLFSRCLHRIFICSYRWVIILRYYKVLVEIKNLHINKFKIKIKEKLCKKEYYKILDYLTDQNQYKSTIRLSSSFRGLYIITFNCQIFCVLYTSILKPAMHRVSGLFFSRYNCFVNV